MKLFIDDQPVTFDISKQAVQSSIIANYTFTLDILGGRFNSLKIYSIDALIELVKMACEMGGINARNSDIYKYVCNFQDKSYKLYEVRKVAQSICMDSKENSYEYQLANQQLQNVTKKFTDFQNRIITYAWNAKLRAEY
jgi:hypothetical protein